MRVVALATSAERQQFVEARKLPPFDASQIEDQLADLHLCALTESGEVHARCSLWWNEVPPHAAQRIGVIGHYASADDASASLLLEAAIGHLRQHGCSLAVGPMDGNTWRSYRFVTQVGAEPDTEPAFFLEPKNPPEWPLQFERAGFTRMAEYFSAINGNLAQKDERSARHAARLAEHGVRIRTAEGEDIEELLGRIYNLRLHCVYAELSLYRDFRARLSRAVCEDSPSRSTRTSAACRARFGIGRLSVRNSRPCSGCP